MSLSTHVLDTVIGGPAAGVPVRLEYDHSGRWLPLATGTTDADGRLRDFVSPGDWRAGRYRLTFDTAAYLGPAAFFPEVSVVFAVTDPGRHHHVPLLLSPYGYSTYRGS